MNQDMKSYKQVISGLLDEICADEAEAIQKAAQVMGDSIMRGQVIHVIGPGGHSNMAVEEMFSRAGGLASINAILDPGTNLSHGGFRSMKVEWIPGYAKAVLESYGVGKTSGEVLLIINAYGINSMTIDCALEAKRLGVTSIAITSSSFAERVPKEHPSRHPTGKNLYQTVDIYLNNHLPYGDAILKVEGCEQNIGPTSTFCNCFVADCLVLETCKYMVSKGYTPPVLRSGNMPGGDEYNQHLVDQYHGKSILLF